MILAVTILLTIHAAAQTTHKHTGKITMHKKTPVKDTVIMNFKVCKSDNGYAICGQNPGNTNSTFEEPPKPRKHPVYEDCKANVIVLKGVPSLPKVAFPLDKPGPETQSGAFLGISSWNGLW